MLFPIGLIVLLSCFCSCKKHEAFVEPYPPSPACDLIQSRISSAYSINAAGDTSYSAYYKYDQQNRLIYVHSMSSFEPGLTTRETIDYIGSSIINRRTEKVNEQNQSTFRLDRQYILDYLGRNTSTAFYWGKDTNRITTKYMYYDGSNQLRASATYSSQKSWSVYSPPEMTDSTIYHWENGNIAWCRGYNDTTTIRYSYLEGSNGRNSFIAGYDDLHLIYNPAVKQAYSKNLLVETTAEYFFDNSKRIYCKKLPGNLRCYYVYKCI